MGNSIELYYMEMTLWISCMSLLGWVSYKILKNIILEDLEIADSIENYQHKYSSIIAIISASIFTILFYRVSNKFYLDHLVKSVSGNMVIYFVILVLGFFIGYIWMGFSSKRFHELNDDYFLNDEDLEQKKFHSKNIFVFMLAVSFFSLLMASPSMVEQEIPILRELFLMIFFGATIRMLFGNTNSNDTVSFFEKIKKFFS